MDGLDYDKPTIITANHQSSLDPFIVISFMPFGISAKLLPLCFMTANRYYFGLARPFAYLLGCFPAKENKQNIDYGIDGSVKKIRQGYNLCIFPEGRRTQPGTAPAKTGVKVIMDNFEDYNLILIHLQWSKLSPLRRNLELTYKLADKRFSDAQSLLDEIYDL